MTDAQVLRDVETYGDAFLSVDASIALYKRLGITESWVAWEFPRRLATLDRHVDIPDLQREIRERMS